MVNVPLFINEGDVLKIDTRDGKYLTRVAAASLTPWRGRRNGRRRTRSDAARRGAPAERSRRSTWTRSGRSSRCSRPPTSPGSSWRRGRERLLIRRGHRPRRTIVHARRRRRRRPRCRPMQPVSLAPSDRRRSRAGRGASAPAADDEAGMWSPRPSSAPSTARRRRTSLPSSTWARWCKKGQVLCIIEAMKLMNEIEAEVAGQGRRDPGGERAAGGVRPAAVPHRAGLRRHVFKKILIANRGRDRPAGHPRLPRAGDRAPSRCTPPPTPTRSTCASPTRRSASARRPRKESYLNIPAHPLRRGDHPRRRHPPRLRLPLRERRVRRGVRELQDPLHRPAPGDAPADGQQGARPRGGEGGGAAAAARARAGVLKDPREARGGRRTRSASRSSSRRRRAAAGGA